ncbi:MAG: MFS transporter [Chloroflexi bacterium]|nr:MFS transporter [Chloroflexota bacterium]
MAPRAIFPKADAYKLYLLAMGLSAFATTLAYTVHLVYQVKQVGLNPLQLVLVGTTLELTALLTEIPTGVVADVYSRRLSVIVGFLLLGLGLILEGSLPVFEVLLVGQVVAGLGYTFLSGATSAWIVDEIGLERAGKAFLRGAQAEQIFAFCGIFVSVALASVSLQLAIVCGGILLALLAAFLALFMPETGFQRRPASDRESWRMFVATFRDGFALVRARQILLLITFAAIIHGAFSEGYDRLWITHTLENFSLPPLGQFDEVVWFGIISAVSMPLSLAVTEGLRRRLDLSDNRQVALTLIGVYAALIGSVLLFILAERFAFVLLGLWLTGAARAVRNPLMEAWINQHTESDVRATVLSIQGQADAFGQIAGGPLVGAVGLLSSVRLAISLSALLLLPILPVFRLTLNAKRSRDSGPD